MRCLRTGLVALAVVMIAPAVAHASAHEAADGPGGWVIDLSDDYSSSLMSPDGVLSVGDCGAGQDRPGIIQLDDNGVVVGETDPSDRHAYFCNDDLHHSYSAVAGEDGRLYVSGEQKGRPVIRTYQYGELVRTTPFWRRESSPVFVDLGIGPGETVVGIIHDASWSSIGARAVGMDGRTGEVRFERKVCCGGAYSPSLEVTDDGFVINHPTDEAIKWYDWSGEPTGDVHRTPDNVYGFAAWPDGRVAYSVYKERYGHGPDRCSYGWVREIRSFDPGSGELRRWKAGPDQCLDSPVRITPDGSVVAWRDVPSYSSRRTEVYRTAGDQLETITPNVPGGFDCSSSCMHDVKVDAYGNAVIILTPERTAKPWGPDVFVGVVDPDDHVLATWLAGARTGEDGEVTVPVAELDARAVTLGLSIYEVWAADESSRLHRVPFGDVGPEYPQSVIVGHPPPPPPSRTYVALGDSFSSGEGVRPYWDGTVWNPKPCHRSQGAYAQVLDRIAPLSLRGFFACSGAVGDNVWMAPQPPGDHVQLDGLDAVQAESGPVDVITMTIGGNDADFAAFAFDCVVGPGCDLGSDDEALIRIAERVPTEVHEALAAIQLRLGDDAKVYVGGYPYLTGDPDEPFPPPVGDCLLLTPDERGAARRVVDALNVAIHYEVLAMADDRFVFVDPTAEGSPFLGHELCTYEPAFFTALDGDDLDTESFHPNALGQRAYAELFAAAIG